ncbi:MAG TPA: hypothetical protein VJN88_09245 [Ktedonobacterales bacterium]|nr:hypothetical protein [Ktedonobacterales bacterium]
MRDRLDAQEAARDAMRSMPLPSGSGSLAASSVSRAPATGGLNDATQETGATLVTLRWLALGQIVAGLCGALIGAIVWLSVAKTATSLVGAVAGMLVALCGVLAIALAGSRREDTRHLARLLPTAADVVACVAVLATGGPTTLALMLFLVPAGVATVSLSWRSAAAVTALDVGLFIVVNVLRAPVMDSWVHQALMLAAISTLLAFVYGVFAAQMTRGDETLRQQNLRLRGQRDQQNAEQQRLLEGLNLLEETQARLEQERVLINAQMAELTSVAYHLADGDLSIARLLRPGMYGSLDVLSGALLRLSQQMVGILANQQNTLGQKRQLDILAAALRDQTAMLTAAETTLRDLSGSANALVSEVQRVERGSGELPGLESHALFQALRSVEQRAMEQAANTGVLSSRMAQLRGRQAELEAEARRASQAATESAFNPAGSFAGSYPGNYPGNYPGGFPGMASGSFGGSGPLAREPLGAPATPSWPHFVPGR